MNTEKKAQIIEEINNRQKKYRSFSRLYLASIFLTILSFFLFPLFIYYMSENFDTYSDFDYISFLSFGSIIIIIILLFIFSSLYKYNEAIANFWYSRAISLVLYESETDISLKDLVSSFSSEDVKPSIMRAPDLSPIISRIAQATTQK